MQAMPTIQEVTKRAANIGVTMKALCYRAGISNSTFTRWKSGRSEPLVSSYLRLIDALEVAEKETEKSQ